MRLLIDPETARARYPPWRSEVVRARRGSAETGPGRHPPRWRAAPPQVANTSKSSKHLRERWGRSISRSTATTPPPRCQAADRAQRDPLRGRGAAHRARRRTSYTGRTTRAAVDALHELWAAQKIDWRCSSTVVGGAPHPAGFRGARHRRPASDRVDVVHDAPVTTPFVYEGAYR